MRRASHQIADDPPVFCDPFALRILPAEAQEELAAVATHDSHPAARSLRAFMAARSRFAEDELAAAVGSGVRQYLLLGAGLDTFAWRNPHLAADLHVFEIDHPATQSWKLDLASAAGLSDPPAVSYVPLDFERDSMGQRLEAAGFSLAAPAFVAWLGVVPYLTLQAFHSTLTFLEGLAPNSGIVFDYPIARELLTPSEQAKFDWLARRVALAGEPFQLSFAPAVLAADFAQIGWHINADLDSNAINCRFFAGRADGLGVVAGAGRLAKADNFP